MPGVAECVPVSKAYKLVSRDHQAESTVVRIPTALGEVRFGGSAVAMIAGPAQLKAVHRRLRLRSASRRQVRDCFAEAHTSAHFSL